MIYYIENKESGLLYLEKKKRWRELWLLWKGCLLLLTSKSTRKEGCIFYLPVFLERVCKYSETQHRVMRKQLTPYRINRTGVFNKFRGSFL